jgi:AcrR family transcriptional regulator
MQSGVSPRSRPRSPKPLRSPNRRNEVFTARARLLESAGQVFASRGFYGVTGKDICEPIGANSAAINYYFGGMDGLYEAAIAEALSRLREPTMEIDGKQNAAARLRAYLEDTLRRITDSDPSSWGSRLIARELISPRAAVDGLIKGKFLPRVDRLREIVAEYMELPKSHPAVARGYLCAIAPCSVLLLADSRIFEQISPNLGFPAGDTKSLIDDLVSSTLAGLKTMAKTYR